MSLRSRKLAFGAFTGVMWGGAVPLLFTDGSSVGTYVVCIASAVPVCGLLMLLLGRVVGRTVSDGEAEFRRSAAVLMPSTVLLCCPISLFLPYGGLPWLICGAVFAVILHRALLLIVNSGLCSDEFAARIVLAGLFILCFIVFFQTNIVHDAFQYYGYLVSACFDGDLNLYDEIYIHNVNRFYNPFPAHSARYVGTAVLEAPFLGAGHLLAQVLNGCGAIHAENGYSEPYLMCVSLASPLFGLAGLALCFASARRVFGAGNALLASVLVLLATPLLFFMYCWNGWPHPFAFFFVALFLAVWERTRGERTLLEWTVLGVVGGWIALVQPAGTVVFVCLLCEAVGTRPWRWDGRRWRGWLVGGVCFAAACILVFSPQLSVWKTISGEWVARPYHEVGDYHSWVHPEIAGLLFSATRHGVFVWTPLALVAVCGVPLLWRRDRMFGCAAALILLLSLYLYACWSIWWSGVGFSNRFFVHLGPVFVLGLAALASAGRHGAWRDCMSAIGGCLAVSNVVLVAAYRRGSLPMGIPDPGRVLDAPVSAGTLISQIITHGRANMLSLTRDYWINRNCVMSGLRHAAVFRNWTDMAAWTLFVVLLATIGWAVVRHCLREDRRRLLVAGVWASVLAVVTVHGYCWSAAGRTRGMPEFYHFDEMAFEVRRMAEPTVLYATYPRPVVKVDLLSSLIHGHYVPQGTVVAEATVRGINGEVHRYDICAGIHTAESSYSREEYRDRIGHSVKELDIVRSEPMRIYSRRRYEFLTFRSVLALPGPMVVKSISFRYVGSAGILVVSDVFMREL